MYNKVIDQKLDIATGYAYFLDYEHPLATGNSGRVYVHRHVMSVKLGRWITPLEHVHHIDENKLNNTPNNLEVLSAKEHGILHNGTEHISKICPVCEVAFEVPKSGLGRITCSYVCARKKNQKIEISKEELEKLIWEFPYIKVASMVGLSDKGVVKKAKSLGCKMPPPYYHSRSKK